MPRYIGIVPLGIGLTVLVSVWLEPFGGFGSSPLFFRVFASFVALSFVMTGWSLLSGNLPNANGLADMLRRARRRQRELEDELRGDFDDEEHAGSSPGGYVCTSCGAPLGRNADVSPHGDAKCPHCGRWFNIHGK